MTLPIAKTGADAPTTGRAPWAFLAFVLVAAPIAAALATFYLGRGDQWAGAILTVGLLMGGAFGLLSRFGGVKPGTAAFGFVFAACLSVPWGFAIFATALHLACRGQEQCFS